MDNKKLLQKIKNILSTVTLQLLKLDCLEIPDEEPYKELSQRLELYADTLRLAGTLCAKIEDTMKVLRAQSIPAVRRFIVENGTVKEVTLEEAANHEGLSVPEFLALEAKQDAEAEE